MALDILWHNQTLFKQPEVFDNAYLPESFDYRGGQLQAMADCIRPAMQGLKPLSCKILGETATGKTTSIKLVFKEAENESKDIYLVHVNGSLFQNTFAIFSKLHKEIIGFEPPSSGVPLKEIYGKIFTKLEKKKASLILAIDDAVYVDDLNKVVYDTLRACELFNVRTGVWLVGTPRDKFKIDEKSESVFAGQRIIFPKYREDELYSILKKRADYGLHKGVVDQPVLQKIARLGLERDLRFALEMLKMSVLGAESRSRKKIELGDVDTAMSKFSTTAQGEKMIEKEILSLLKEKNFTSGDLFNELKKKNQLSYSSFNRNLVSMEEKGLIIREAKQASEGGRTSEIGIRK